MLIMIVTSWRPDDAGCIFKGSPVRTADELHAAVIQLAASEGWTEAGEGAVLAWYTVGWRRDPYETDLLSEAAMHAQKWLNEHVAPEGFVFVFDDGFYLSRETTVGEAGY
jgi:hypothetical protein